MSFFLGFFCSVGYVLESTPGSGLFPVGTFLITLYLFRVSIIIVWSVTKEESTLFTCYWYILLLLSPLPYSRMFLKEMTEMSQRHLDFCKILFFKIIFCPPFHFYFSTWRSYLFFEYFHECMSPHPDPRVPVPTLALKSHVWQFYSKTQYFVYWHNRRISFYVGPRHRTNLYNLLSLLLFLLWIIRFTIKNFLYRSYDLLPVCTPTFQRSTFTSGSVPRQIPTDRPDDLVLPLQNSFGKPRLPGGLPIEKTFGDRYCQGTVRLGE